MVVAVHEGYIARLTLVRKHVLSKPRLRPGWGQDLQELDYSSLATAKPWAEHHKF